MIRYRTVFPMLLAVATVGVAVSGAMLGLPAGAQALSQQMSSVEAQMRHERALAECNAGSLAAPDRQTCVRNAGQVFDNQRAGLQAPNPTTADGRATVVPSTTLPAVIAVPADSTTTGMTSQDGRATIIAPTVVPQ